MRLRVALALVLHAACGRARPSERAGRIVSTAPSVTEIAFALGLGEAVVGVSDHCAHPPEATTRPRVGTYLAPGVETILALRPDLVLLDDVQADAARALGATGVRTLRLRLKTLDDVRAAAREVGRATGHDAEAAALVARMDAELRAAPRLRGRPRVLLVIHREPGTLRNLYAAASSSYAGALLERAGARNVLDDTPLAYPKIAVETVVARAPEVIVEVTDEGVDAAAARHDWAALASVPAVRTGSVFATHDQLLTTPGPRAARALAGLVETIAPAVRGSNPP